MLPYLSLSCVVLCFPIETWTYEDLWVKSECVFIGHVVATRSVDNKEFIVDHLDRFESEVKILTTLKGKHDGPSFRIVHFRYKPGRNKLGNGPDRLFLETRSPDEPDYKWPKVNYLFFLKLRPDGAFDPISGHDIPNVAVPKLEGYASEILRRTRNE